jgi:hypothetical protein
MRLNQTIEDELGKGDCANPSAPYTHTGGSSSTTSGALAGSGPTDRGGSLRINHAHDELMGMGEHGGHRD